MLALFGLQGIGLVTFLKFSAIDLSLIAIIIGIAGIGYFLS